MRYNDSAIEIDRVEDTTELGDGTVMKDLTRN